MVLGEIEVKANKVFESNGKTILFPSNNEVKTSPTTISLFQKLPLAGLEVNPINRVISVDGGSPVILINGVPSTADDFNAIEPKDIAKIEYSRITPIRYADKGLNGFINITLKKRDNGGQLYLWGRSAVNTAFVDANIRASYHQGFSQFSLTYSPSWRNYQNVYDDTRESYIGDDFKVNLEVHDRNPFRYMYHDISASYDYSPNVNTLFTATLRLNPSADKGRIIGETYDSYYGKYTNRNLTTNSSFTPSLDLFFKHNINEKNSIEVQVVGTLGSSKYRRNNRFLYSDESIADYSSNVDGRRKSLISEISYVHQFGNNTTLSVGYQNTVSHSTNKYLNTDYQPTLKENNNYVYASISHQIGRIYLTLSTGAKLFWIDNDLNHRKFMKNLSSIQFAWNISQNWNINAAFRYTPTIPSLSALTDYQQQLSPYLVSNGNPDLKVAKNFIYQLMPSFHYKKLNASLGLNYRQIDDFVMNDVVYLGEDKFLSQSINAKKSWYGGGNLSIQLNDIVGFGAQINLELGHYETIGDSFKHKLTSFEGSFSVWWNKGPYTLAYWRKIPGKYLSGNSVYRSENGDSFSF